MTNASSSSKEHISLDSADVQPATPISQQDTLRNEMVVDENPNAKIEVPVLSAEDIVQEVHGAITKRSGPSSTPDETPQIASTRVGFAQDLNTLDIDQNGSQSAERMVEAANVAESTPTLRSFQVAEYHQDNKKPNESKTFVKNSETVDVSELIPPEVRQNFNFSQKEEFMDALEGVFKMYQVIRDLRSNIDDYDLSEVSLYLKSCLVFLDDCVITLVTNPDMKDFYQNTYSPREKEKVDIPFRKMLINFRTAFPPKNSEEEKELACALLIPAYQEALRQIEELKIKIQEMFNDPSFLENNLSVTAAEANNLYEAFPSEKFKYAK